MRATYVLVKSLTELLNQFVEIGHMLQSKNPAFYNALIDWINRAETLLLDHRIPASAKLTGLKAKILHPQFSEAQKRHKRNAELSVASQSMYELQDCLQQVLQPKLAVIEEARALFNQYMMILSDSGAITYELNEDLPHFTHKLYGFMASHEQLKPNIIGLRGKLQQDELLCILTEEIDTQLFMKNKLEKSQ